MNAKLILISVNKHYKHIRCLQDNISNWCLSKIPLAWFSYEILHWRFKKGEVFCCQVITNLLPNMSWHQFAAFTHLESSRALKLQKGQRNIMCCNSGGIFPLWEGILHNQISHLWTAADILFRRHWERVDVFVFILRSSNKKSWWTHKLIKQKSGKVKRWVIFHVVIKQEKLH